MPKFLKSLGSVSLTMILALGWAWSGMLKDLGYLDENKRLNLLIVLTVLLAGQQIYLEFPKPAKRGIVENRRKIVENELERFLDEYYGILESRFGANHVFPIVRVNMMLPTRKTRITLNPFLRIYYTFSAAGAYYTGEELSLQWKKEEGTCGWAWAKNSNGIYDSIEPDLQLPAKRLAEAKKDVVKNIKSTVSIPIWLEDKVVGVLNLDSKQNVKDTLFVDAEVLSLAVACSRIISGQCHEDGIEER